MSNLMGSFTRVLFFLLISIFIALSCDINEAKACGHQGFYLGGGYEQYFAFSPDRSMGYGRSRVKFTTQWGGLLLFGYDFEGSRFGIQVPFEGGSLILNKSEKIYYFSGNVEGIMHVLTWENGIDIYVLAGTGGTYFTEGTIPNRSAAGGVNVSAGAGFGYYFLKDKKVTGALKIDLPIRYTYFPGYNLTEDGTNVFSFPIRAYMTFGF